MTLDEETRAYLARLVDDAPPLSPEQERVIAAAFQAGGDA